MQTAESLERIAYELAEDAARGRRPLHGGALRPDPQRAGWPVARRGGRGAAPRARPRRARSRHHRARDRLRAAPPPARDLARRWRSWRSSTRREGVVGFDLAGGEAGHPASHARRGVRATRARTDWPAPATPGKGTAPSPSGRRCTSAAPRASATPRGSSRIRSLTDEVNESRITLEICLTSNVQTHAARVVRDAPFRQYFDRGSTSCSTPTTA